MRQSSSRKRKNTNIFLLFVVCSLSWLVYLQIKKDEQRPKVLYSDQMGEQVEGIRIQRPQQPDIEMVTGTPKWKMTQPVVAKVNMQALRQLLTLLSEPILASYPAEGKLLVRYGLGAKAIIVTFNQVEYRLGDLNPMNHQRYVLFDGQILLVNEVVYELLSRGIQGFKEDG